ncbi:NAD(P)-dependent oxidoreductase [Clostridium ganghwense]|uniref:NAD(P)-dependent oxidoreductase n=1 Tax=Clostridium ganghwense TaxID=312089 RepID=A0ABT4CR78_9CLOT|nr:NAD(P)-dependent oxidoreductase [Clostridium ganghwense]MCY6371433.1 NAD(P)-dependent oxidoreductase [Clostridium ganghwense]
MQEKINKEEIIKKAERCLQCKNPRCIQGCPISTSVPEFINLLLQGQEKKAGEMLFKNNPLSVVCSLVCPHERQCQGNCVLGIKGDAVDIGTIEQYLSNNYLNEKVCKKEDEHIGKIAIVGSGPAGISIAFILAIKGYDITLFESHDKIGGVLRYGIPEFRLPKEILDRLKNKLVELGVKIRPNTLIGSVITIDDLFRDKYDAVFIGTGVWQPKKLNIPGESLGHVHYAIDYLKNPQVYELGNRVCVIGAGNVAMDVARTAVRKGANEVYIMYRKGRENVSATNHEIESALEEGVKFEFYKTPVEIVDDGVKYLKTQKIEDKDKNIKFVTINNSEDILKADSIIIAVSQGPKSNIVSKTKDIKTNISGLLITDECGRTTKEGVFASGDVVTGAKTVVEAVNHSKKVAEAIHIFVNKKSLTPN